MNKEELLRFYNVNKDRHVTIGFRNTKEIPLKDLFKLFQLLQEEQENDI